MGNITTCCKSDLHKQDSLVEFAEQVADVVELRGHSRSESKKDFVHAEVIPCLLRSQRLEKAASPHQSSPRRRNVEIAEAASPRQSSPRPRNDEIAEELDDSLNMFEMATQSIVVRYRQTAVSKENLDRIKRADDTLQRVVHQLRRLQLFKVRGQTWQGGEEADKWLNMFAGKRKRFRNLADVVRKVKVENRIVRHWKQAVLLRKGSSESGNAVLTLLDEGSEPLDLESFNSVNVFDLEKECHQPLSRIFLSIWQSRKLGNLCKTKKKQVVEYILAVENSYKDVHYHNRMHAAEVTMTAYFFWSSLSAQRSFHGYFNEVDLLVLLVSAAIHDIAHPGVSNDFLVKTNSTLALRYHDRSILENFHVAFAFQLMQDKEIQLLEHNLPGPPVSSLRSRIVDIVLATDVTVHKRVLEEFCSEVSCHPNRQDIDKTLLEKQLVHFADIGHPFRPVQQHQEWSRRIAEEFFAQGDQEKSLGFTPISLFDREKAPSVSKSQLGFLNFIVKPAWLPLKDLLGPAAVGPQKQLDENVQVWQAQADLEDASSKKGIV